MNVCSIKINRQVILMTDTIMFTLFFILPIGFFVYMAIDQLLWIHDMDLDTQVIKLYNWLVK